MQYFIKTDLSRLIKLLEYSYEAIDYWFNGCNVSDQLKNENEYFLIESLYFIDRLKELLK